MEGLLGGLSLGELGPAGLLSLVVVLMLLGRLVPRSTLLDQKKETEYWRESHRNSEAARELLSGTLLEMTDSVETIEHLIRSLPTAPRSDNPEMRK